MSLLVLSWSTCPSLYVNSVGTLVGARSHAGACAHTAPVCDCCHQQAEDRDTPPHHEKQTPERCPLCESIGSMHALVTVDAPPALAAPTATAELIVIAPASAPRERAAERLEQAVSPPDEQFTTTVRFLC
jgi:hypothetical protein